MISEKMIKKSNGRKKANFGKWIAIAITVSEIFGAFSARAQTPQTSQKSNPVSAVKAPTALKSTQPAQNQNPETKKTAFMPTKPLRVGYAGHPPFIQNSKGKPSGISWEIWEAVADKAGWKYTVKNYTDVPTAISELKAGKMDVLVGPVSITADRVQDAVFTQPYFQSSLAILSHSEPPTFWQRLSPFFSRAFFVAIGILLLVLAIVGTLIWLAERRTSTEDFPRSPARGIGNGIWCAVVTMTTVGYGDRAPATLLGRIVAGTWMVLSLIVATSLIAGIASTLALSSVASVQITTAEQMHGHKIAVVTDSPSVSFVRHFGGKIIAVDSIAEGFRLLKNRSVKAFVYDRPQLLYYLQEHQDNDLKVSKAEYMRQGYGFALPLDSKLIRPLDIDLLKLDETGRIKRILKEWLGDTDEE